MGIIPGDYFTHFWRFVKPIWPLTLCCVLLLNTTRDLLIFHLFFLRVLAGKIQKGAIMLLLITYSSFTI